MNIEDRVWEQVWGQFLEYIVDSISESYFGNHIYSTAWDQVLLKTQINAWDHVIDKMQDDYK